MSKKTKILGENEEEMEKEGRRFVIHERESEKDKEVEEGIRRTGGERN